MSDRFFQPGSRFSDFPSVLHTNRILSIQGQIGVIVDPTTAGIGDSERAMGYEVPWDDDGEE